MVKVCEYYRQLSVPCVRGKKIIRVFRLSPWRCMSRKKTKKNWCGPHHTTPRVRFVNIPLRHVERRATERGYRSYLVVSASVRPYLRLRVQLSKVINYNNKEGIKLPSKDACCPFNVSEVWLIRWVPSKETVSYSAKIPLFKKQWLLHWKAQKLWNIDSVLKSPGHTLKCIFAQSKDCRFSIT